MRKFSEEYQMEFISHPDHKKSSLVMRALFCVYDSEISDIRYQFCFEGVNYFLLLYIIIFI